MEDTSRQWALRTAVAADAERLTDLHLDVWDDAYRGLLPDHLLDERRRDVPARVARWRQRLAPGGPPTLLAETTGGEAHLVGFASAGPARDRPAPAPLELWALYARRSWWGTAVGHRLLEAVLGGAPAYLWVLAGNDRAAAFYRRHGFLADGVVQDTGHGRDLRMVRS